MEDILGDILGTSSIAPLGGAPRSGSTLFVINLCASMAPISVPGKTLPGLESYRLYQVARVEDGRPRHRLRLGFFQNEADAEGVLESVRARYPTAFATCLSEDDRRYARGFLPASLQDASDTTILRNLSTVMTNGSSVATTGMFKVAIASDATDTASTVRQPVLKIALAQPTSEITRETEQPIKAASRHAASIVSDEIILEDLSWTADEPVATPITATASPAAGPRAPASPPAAKVVVARTQATPVVEASVAAQEAHASITPSAAPLPAAKVIAAKSPAAFKPISAPKLPEAPKPIQTAPKALVAAAQSAAAKPVEAPSKAAPQIPALPMSLAIEAPLVAPAPGATASKPSVEPFRVDRGIQIPQTGLSLEAEAPAPAAASPAPAAKAPAIAASAAPAKTTPKSKPPAAAVKPAMPTAARPVTPSKPAAAVTDLDSTQTIRALTAAELNDSNQPKWFVVQLAISEQAINLDTMPHLDIFSAYRLYSVATAGSGKILHSLRLGFFKEEVSAQAVTGYLKTFFSSPSVIRVAVSEQSRFSEPPAAKEPAAQPISATAPVATKPVAAKKEESSKIIELREVRDRIGKALDVPTVTMEIESPTGSHKKLSSKSAHKHSGTAAKRASTPVAKGKTGSTGKHRSLQEELVAEARSLSASAIRKLPKNDSLLSKLVDKLKK